jgi:hypothetical protein
MLKVSFDYNDTLRVLGYDVIAGRPDVANGKVGWPQLRKQYESCTAGTNDERPQFANFTTLNPGEFDFMSSGGAYIFGNNKGRLRLSGGPASITLIKNEFKIDSRAQQFQFVADDTTLRIGQVRRDRPDGTNKPLATDTAGSLKEFNVAVKSSTPTLPLATFRLGDVAGDVVAELSSSGNPLRCSLETYGGTTDPMFGLRIDTVGNTECKGKAATLNTEYVATTFKSSASHTVDSPSIKLGKSATNWLLTTNTYGPAEQQVITQLAAQIQALAAQVAILSAALGVFAGAVGGALVPIAIPSATMTAAATAAALAVTASGAAATAAASTFTGAYETYKSKVSETE